MSADLEKIVWMAVSLIAIGLLIGGLCDKCVIYYDKLDVVGSILAVALPCLGIWLFKEKVFDSDLLNILLLRVIGAPICIIVGSVFLVKNFILSIRHNRNVPLGVVIGLYKICFVLFSFITLLGCYSEIDNRRSTFRDYAFVSLFLIVFGKIATAMVNGERVYIAKGWHSNESGLLVA